MKVGEIGSGTSVECRFGCGDCRGSGSGTREWGGCLVRRLVLVYTSALFWISCWCSISHPCAVSCHPSLFWTVVFHVESVSGEQQTVSGWHSPETRAAAGVVFHILQVRVLFS